MLWKLTTFPTIASPNTPSRKSPKFPEKYSPVNGDSTSLRLHAQNINEILHIMQTYHDIFTYRIDDACVIRK
jgi:hypothetical protein